MADQSYRKLKILENDNDIHTRYARVRVLGSGFFGQTYEVTDLRDPQNQLYAMKVQPKTDPHCQFEGGPIGELTRLFKEIVILNRILPRHPNIIEIKDVLISPNELYIVTELCAKGKDLTAFCLVADNVSGRRAFGQLVETIRTLHLYGVAHCDLKGDNILFKDAAFKQLKLIDFGCSNYKPEWASEKIDNFDHTKWFDPEELAYVPDNTRSQDIIALGGILHNIMCGKANPMFMSDRIRKMQTLYRPRTEIFDAAAMDLLCKIGPPPFGPQINSGNLEQLVTLDEILAHPWLTWEEGVTWNPPEPSDNQLSQNLEELRNDLSILSRILNEWMVIPLTPVSSEEAINRYYEVVGSSQRGDEVTEVLDVVDHLTRSRKMEMRLIFGRMLDNPEDHSRGTESKDPLLVYLELLIISRILPPHERFVDIKSIYVNKKFVAMVRERMEGHTMEYFIAYHARNVISSLVFRQLAEAVRFMHQHGVVHMDLHPHHIVWATTNSYSRWKIVNFSKARFTPEMALYRYENFQARRYLTPELFQLAGIGNIQVDITALGRILHGLMSGVWEPDPAKCVNHFPRREVFEDAASDLLSKIGPEPFGPPASGRTITMEEICLHPWIRTS